METDKKPDNPWYFYIGNQLVKKHKPCLSGDYVHLKGFTGCYKIHETSIRFFTIIKNHKEIKLPWEQFRCLKGHGDSEEVLLKRELRSLIKTIDISISTQTLTNGILNEELKNLRRTFA